MRGRPHPIVKLSRWSTSSSLFQAFLPSAASRSPDGPTAHGACQVTDGGPCIRHSWFPGQSKRGISCFAHLLFSIARPASTFFPHPSSFWKNHYSPSNKQSIKQQSWCISLPFPATKLARSLWLRACKTSPLTTPKMSKQCLSMALDLPVKSCLRMKCQSKKCQRR